MNKPTLLALGLTALIGIGAIVYTYPSDPIYQQTQAITEQKAVVRLAEDERLVALDQLAKAQKAVENANKKLADARSLLEQMKAELDEMMWADKPQTPTSLGAHISKPAADDKRVAIQPPLDVSPPPSPEQPVDKYAACGIDLTFSVSQTAEALQIPEDDVRALSVIANKQGIHPSYLIAIGMAENLENRHENPVGDGGCSHGPFQYNFCSNPVITTKEKAQDLYTSASVTAQRIKTMYRCQDAIDDNQDWFTGPIAKNAAWCLASHNQPVGIPPQWYQDKIAKRLRLMGREPYLTVEQVKCLNS